MKILISQSKGIPPSDTGQGTSIIQYALIHGLLKCECDLAYQLLSGKNRYERTQKKTADTLATATDQGLHYEHHISKNFKEDIQHLQAICDSFNPDFIIVYNYEGIKLADAVNTCAKIVATSIDLEHLPKCMRYQMLCRYESGFQKLIYAINHIGLLKESYRNYRKTKRYYPLADAHISHAAHHAKWIETTFGKPVIYTPNPVYPLNPEPPTRTKNNIQTPPVFLLLGGLQGVATISGLYFFAHHVLPYIKDDLANKTFEVHLVGRDKLNSDLAKTLVSNGITHCGFIENLAQKMQSATAMLVPTEIKLGFRTRILDALRYRLAVITHSANAEGFPEIKESTHTLLASTGKEFADHMRQLAHHPDDALARGESGFLKFTNHYQAKHTGHSIYGFLQQLQH